MEGYACGFCQRKYSHKRSLGHHLKLIHAQELKETKGSEHVFSCQAENCAFTFQELKSYRTHLHERHGLLCANQVLEFSSKEDFSTWREKMQTENNTQFHTLRTKQLAKGKRTYFDCNRSGVFKTKGKGLRQLKSQGSCRTGHRCPSSFTLTENVNSEILMVEYFSTHYGHDQLLGHCTIPKTIRNDIAGQLARGIPEKRVLANYRSSVETKLNREHLLTFKDISNVRNGFKIPRGLHNYYSVQSNDLISVDAWVESQRELRDDNAVVLYKKQGEEFPDLQEKDFVLVIMSQFQKKMASKYSNGRVCIDSTHNVTGTEFELTTLLLIDNFEEGFPAAFFVTSRVNKEIMTACLQSVKDAAGLMKPSHFMSDDTSFMYEAWSFVMSDVPHKLLCSWHVDRAWQEHLSSIKDLGKRTVIYTSLKDCLYELDPDKFHVTLCKLFEQLSEDEDANVGQFRNYFLKNYSNCLETWAYCFRAGAKINTSMHLENLHRQLKQIHAEGIKSKRVDKLIQALMSYFTDKLFDQIIKLHKGQTPRRDRDVLQDHRAGELLATDVTSLDADTWSCQSQTTVDVLYCVQRIPHICHSTTCRIMCPQCCTCLNSFKCSCQEFGIHANSEVCKHIHAVNIFEMSHRVEKNSASPTPMLDVQHHFQTKFIKESWKETDLDQINNAIGKLQVAVNLLQENIPKHIADEILKHLECANKLCNLPTSEGNQVV